MSFDVKPAPRDLDGDLPARLQGQPSWRARPIPSCAPTIAWRRPCLRQSDLLQKRLRDEWGFQGYVVSDCGAISDIYRFHKYKPTPPRPAPSRSRPAPTSLRQRIPPLVDAVKNGLITESGDRVRSNASSSPAFKLGMFDPPERVPFSKIPITR